MNDNSEKWGERGGDMMRKDDWNDGENRGADDGENSEDWSKMM